MKVFIRTSSMSYELLERIYRQVKDAKQEAKQP